MKKRRYHITKDEGELIILALDLYIDEVERILEKENIPYWRWKRLNAISLQKDLHEYKWEV